MRCLQPLSHASIARYPTTFGGFFKRCYSDGYKSGPYRLMVRTSPFHGGNPGSTPGRVTMIESFIKILISIPLITAALFSTLLIIRLWNTQIDTSQTIRMWFGTQLSLSSWIITRDTNSIYQNGRLIGKVEESPIVKDNRITFPRIRYVSFMDEKQVIEYQRFKCDKVKVNETERIEGMESVSWYKNLECEIINNSD